MLSYVKTIEKSLQDQKIFQFKKFVFFLILISIRGVKMKLRMITKKYAVDSAILYGFNKIGSAPKRLPST